MSRSGLVLRLLRQRWRLAAALGVMTAVLAFLLVTSATTASMVRSAQLDSVVSGAGGYPYIAQAQDPSDAETLARVRGAVAVTTRPATASAADLALPVDQRDHSVADAYQGRLLSGSPPRRPGEALVSAAVADSLGVVAGQRIALTPTGSRASRTVEVTGVTVDPGFRGATFVDVLSPVEPSDATSWLLPTDPFEDEALAAPLQARTITGRTTEVLAQDSAATGPNAAFVASARRGGRALLAASVLLLTASLLLMARSCRRSVLALEAAGMPRARGWGVVVRAAALVLIASTLVGEGVALLTVWALRSPLAGAFGQCWTVLTVSVGWMVAVLVVLVVLSPVLAVVVTLRGRTVISGAPLTLTAPGPWLSTGLVAAGAIGWIVLATFPRNPLWAVVASAPVITGCYFLASSLVADRQPSSIRTLSRRGMAQLLPLTAIMVLIGVGCGSFAALGAANTELMRTSSVPNQPPGSIAVLSVDDAARQQLVRRFEELGGRSITWYAVPDEQTMQLRVTNPRLVECSREDPAADVDMLLQRCGPRDTMVPTNYVVLAGERSPEGGASAAPALVEGGRVGLLQYVTGGDRVVATDIVRASADGDLGENLPGAVVALDSATASKFALVPSGQELLVADGFGEMGQDEQLRFRAALLALAPTAQVAEGAVFDASASNRTANLVAGVGAAAVVALVIAGALAWSSSQTSLRMALAELGVGTRARTILALRLCAPAIAAGVAAVVSLVAIAWFFGAHSLALGWWPVPAAVAALAPLILVAAHARVPSG